MSVVIVIAVVTISNVCLSLFFTCMSAICNLKQTCMCKDLNLFSKYKQKVFNRSALYIIYFLIKLQCITFFILF